MKKVKGIKPRFEVVDIPDHGRGAERRQACLDLVDKLMTLETNQAIKVDIKDFMSKSANGLKQTIQAMGKKKKLSLSTYVNEDTITVWRKASC